MKKVLSWMLAIAMMLTAAPFAFAEEAEALARVTITGTGTTTFELEQYNTFTHTAQSDGTVSTKVMTPATNTLADGTEVSFLRTGWTTPGSMTTTIPIHVEESGRYQLEVMLSDPGHLSKPHYAIDGVEIPRNLYSTSCLDTTVKADDGSETILYYFGAKDYPSKHGYIDTYVTAGDHDLTVNFNMSDTSNGGLAFAADYIKFTKIETPAAVEIETEGTTRIELENYKKNTTLADGVTCINGSTGLNGTLLSLTEMSLNSDVLVKIPVDVKEAGLYELESVMSYGNSGFMTSAYVSVGDSGTVLSNVSTDTEYFKEDVSAGENGQYFDENYKAVKFGSRIFLEAGQTEIEILLKQRGHDSRICWKGDYISLTPADADVIEISAQEETRVEMENYRNSFDTASTLYNQDNASGNKASGGAYLMWDTGAREKDIFGYFKVNVPEAGFYKVTLIGSHVGTSYASLYVDGNSVLATTDGVEGEEKGDDGKYPTYANMHFAAKKGAARIYLAAGEQWMKIGICRRTITEGGKTFQDVAGCLDYLAFVSDNGPALTVGAGENVIEFEAYKDYVTVDNTTSVACSEKTYDKGTVLNVTERRAKNGTSITIPFTVETAGTYEISMIVSRHTGVWNSATALSLDGEEIMKNEEAYMISDLSKDANGEYDYIDSSYPMGQFGGQQIYLSAGEHTFTYYMNVRESYVTSDQSQVTDHENGIHRVCHVADSITVEKLENYARYEDSSQLAYAEAYTEELVTGTAFVAFYKGKELVGLYTADAILSNILTADAVPCSDRPDTVKFFVWEDMGSFAPVMNPIIVNVAE